MEGIVNLTIYTQPLWRVAVPGLCLGVSLPPWERRYPTGHEKDRQPNSAMRPLSIKPYNIRILQASNSLKKRILSLSD